MITQNPTLQSQISSQQTIVNSLHETFNCQSHALKQNSHEMQTINLHRHPYTNCKSNNRNPHTLSCCSHEQGQKKHLPQNTQNSYINKRMNCQTDANYQNSAFSNILKINTSTYSVTRTTGCIAKRLEQVSRRLETVETSISAKKGNKHKTANKCIIHANTNNCNSNKFEHEKENAIIPPLLINNEQQYTSIIKSQSQNLYELQQKIQKLQEQVLKKDSDLLKKQQKYLKKQKEYILEINRLKKLLQEREDQDNQYYNQKVEKERIVDQYQVTIWQFKQKIKEFQEREKGYNKKIDEIAKLIRLHENRMQKEESSGKTGKYSRRQHELVDRLKQLTCYIDQCQQNKQNINQLSNRGNPKKFFLAPQQNGTQTYRSITAMKNKTKSYEHQNYGSEPQAMIYDRSQNNNHYKGWKTIEKQYIIVEEQIQGNGGKGVDDREDIWDIRVQNTDRNPRAETTDGNQDLYRCMLMQASLIQKLVI